MPRFFFDLHDGDSILDDTGVDLTDIDAARAEAMAILSDLARQFSKDGYPTDREVIVRAEDGNRLLKATHTVRCVALHYDSQNSQIDIDQKTGVLLAKVHT